MRKLHLSLAIAILFLAAVLSANAQTLNQKVGKQVSIRTVAILPAKVEIVRSGMKGPEGMAAESEELSSRVQAVVATVLAGTKRISSGKGAPSNAADPEENYRAADIQSKFDELLPKVAKKKNDVKTGRFTLGDEVLNLGVAKGTDAIVFIRGTGQALTSGKKAFNILVGGTPAYLGLQIVFVDSRSGEVLAYAPAILTGDPMTASDKLRKALEKAFKKLPAAN